MGKSSLTESTKTQCPRHCSGSQAGITPPPSTHPPTLPHLLGQCDEAHVVLRVAAGLGMTDYIDSILLGL